ncbi:Methylated-DNA--protein-cysteine methyltransferase, constitutive [Mannheimia haemolytica]|uniref:Methylated-DNA--protein-cysteine methyltransferase, constitutive n=1 Tax=Mannheimia haemolytica TaxID=75985 RepID=A0A378MY00_MANHA|nr:Methylated-DNA--protein-cysteine methyltransferase, constitutive [Mannheimia haemolytica]
MRAVGGAVGRNPISILVPCHRVLGKNQALTGFGGGLPNKRFLLQLEDITYKDKGIEFVKPKTRNGKYVLIAQASTLVLQILKLVQAWTLAPS